MVRPTATHIPPPPPRSASSGLPTLTWIYLICGVVATALLFFLAYNMGGTMEDANVARTQTGLQMRMSTLSRRLTKCQNDLKEAENGEANEKLALDTVRKSIKVLQGENELYQAGNEEANQKIKECLEANDKLRLQQTGTSAKEPDQVIRHLQYEIHSMELELKRANHSNMQSEQQMRRLVRAYVLENRELSSKIAAKSLRRKRELDSMATNPGKSAVRRRPPVKTIPSEEKIEETEDPSTEETTAVPTTIVPSSLSTVATTAKGSSANASVVVESSSNETTAAVAGSTNSPQPPLPQEVSTSAAVAAVPLTTTEVSAVSPPTTAAASAEVKGETAQLTRA